MLLTKFLFISLFAYCCYARHTGLLEKLLEDILEEENDSTNPCAGGVTGIKDDPTRCDGFLYCVNGIKYEMTCPNELKFDPTNNQCSSERCGKNFFCSGLQEGDYPLTDPSTLKVAHLRRYSWDCSKFVTCANGIAYLRTCPGEGSISNYDIDQFSYGTRNCEIKDVAGCEESPTGTHSTEICLHRLKVYVVGEEWRGANETCNCRTDPNRPRTITSCIKD